VARVTVSASELTAAIRVDGPSEGHARTVASIEDLPDAHLVELDSAMRLERFFDEVGKQVLRGEHASIFVFCSLLSRGEFNAADASLGERFPDNSETENVAYLLRSLGSFGI